MFQPARHLYFLDHAGRLLTCKSFVALADAFHISPALMSSLEMPGPEWLRYQARDLNGIVGMSSTPAVLVEGAGGGGGGAAG